MDHFSSYWDKTVILIELVRCPASIGMAFNSRMIGRAAPSNKVLTGDKSFFAQFQYGRNEFTPRDNRGSFR